MTNREFGNIVIQQIVNLTNCDLADLHSTQITYVFMGIINENECFKRQSFQNLSSDEFK